MTITSEDLQRPVPLRQYLEAGCDPATVGVLAFEHFQDEIVNLNDGALVDDESRRSRAATYRWEVNQLVEGRDPHPSMFGNRDSRDVIVDGWGSLQWYVTVSCWTADLYDDPSLEQLLRAVMTPAERAELDRLIAAAKAPHPLILGRPQSAQRCAGCGRDCSGLALLIGHVEHYSARPDENGWCFSCVTNAYEAMKAAQQ